MTDPDVAGTDKGVEALRYDNVVVYSIKQSLTPSNLSDVALAAGSAILPGGVRWNGHTQRLEFFVCVPKSLNVGGGTNG